MMMGFGILFMLVIGLVVIGVPVLIAALVAGGGLTTLFKPQTRQMEPDHSPSLHKSADEQKCSTCGRAVQPSWNICPSCGGTLT